MKKLSILVSVLSIFAFSSFAEIKMPRIFSDNMMLQRNANVNVWGWASPNSKVNVQFAGQSKDVKANAKGEWLVKLAPMKENAKPQSMFISENGASPVEIKNILVGEVWVLGGQSNMAFGLSGADCYNEYKEIVKKYPIRFFNQGNDASKTACKTPQEDSYKYARWADCQTQPCGGFSAVGLIFATEISEKLNVPVGLLYTAISGTNMYSWFPQDVWDNDPMIEHERKAWERRLKNYDYEKALAKWQKKVDDYEAEVKKAKAEGKEPPKRHYSTTPTFKPRTDSPDLYRTRCELYNGRINPIKRFTVRGVYWYQGCNDGYMKEKFKESFICLMNAWRDAFKNPNMPFVAVQLPSWGTKAPWAEVRQQQYDACRELKNAGIACSIDTGLEDDIHPKDKLPIGKRSAAVALRDVYDLDVQAYGPIVKNVKYMGKVARINFYGGKLVCKGDPRGFEVLCADKWVPAIAKVNGDTVVVKAKEGDSEISGVRYLWKSFAKPDVCIYSSADLPAFPFQLKKAQ